MKLRDLELAFDFVADAPPCEHMAYVSRSTGQTFLQSEWGDDEELPQDLEGSDDLLEIPHFTDLLGKRLVREPTAAEIPERGAEVRSFLGGPGGFRLFRRLLAELGLLDRWHAFEDRSRRETVLNGVRNMVSNWTTTEEQRLSYPHPGGTGASGAAREARRRPAA